MFNLSKLWGSLQEPSPDLTDPGAIEDQLPNPAVGALRQEIGVKMSCPGNKKKQLIEFQSKIWLRY